LTRPLSTDARSSPRVEGLAEAIGHLISLNRRTGGPATGSPVIQSQLLSRAILPRPLIYAHRGGAALRPENTLTAFDNGLALGADGLELDVHLSRDGVVVVHHDPTLERTTNGSGAIRLKTAAELAAIDAGYRFRDLPADGGSHEEKGVASGFSRPSTELGTAVTVPKGRKNSGNSEFPFRGQGIGVPTLREVLARYPVPLIIELKTAEAALARATVDELRAADALDRVTLGSFYGKAVAAARAYEPRLRTGAAREETRWALYKSWVHWPLGRTGFSEFQVPERSGRTTIVTPRFVAAAHRAGVPVKVWTVNASADVARLLSWGVDAIISDRPDVAVKALRAAL
jgi:glycerophosphoryl diester phosphodiesterase